MVVDDGPLDGVLNMARDVELLTRAEAGERCGRVYRWTGPWVSLGMSQIADRDLLEPDLVPWVMRPTGGKAVLHGHDETIGLAAPLASLGVEARSVKAAYRAVITPIVDALNACGRACVLAEDAGLASPKGPRTADCFAHVSANDVVDPITRQKVCGCALRLTDKAVLVQASVPNGLPLIDPQRVFAQPASLDYARWDASGLRAALERALTEASAALAR